MHDFSTEVIHPDVNNLHCLILQVVLAVQGLINHQHTWLKCYRHVGIIKKTFMSTINHRHHCISHPTWRNFQLQWYILMSATSQAFSSLLFLPSTVPSTTKPNEQKVGKWGIQEKGFYWTPKISSLVVCGLGLLKRTKFAKPAVGYLWPFRSWLEGPQCAVPNFWSETDRGSTLVAKWALFMYSSTLLLGWRLKNKYFGLQTSVYENVENPPKRAFWPYKLKL